MTLEESHKIYSIRWGLGHHYHVWEEVLEGEVPRPRILVRDTPLDGPEETLCLIVLCGIRVQLGLIRLGLIRLGCSDAGSVGIGGRRVTRVVNLHGDLSSVAHTLDLRYRLAVQHCPGHLARPNLVISPEGGLI